MHFELKFIKALAVARLSFLRRHLATLLNRDAAQ